MKGINGSIDLVCLVVFVWACCQIFIVSVIQVIKGLQLNEEGKREGKEYWIPCVLINVGTLFVVDNLYHLAKDARNEKLFAHAVASVLMLLALHAFCFVLFGFLREKERQVRRQKFEQQQQMVLFNVQNEDSEKTWSELKKFRHDYANHLICVREYLKKGNSEEAREYVEGLLGSFKGGYGTKKISHSFVDIFLGYKIRNVGLAGVQFKTDIMIPKELPFQEMDLCVILGNAFDNAIDALKKIPEQERYMNITICYRHQALKILFENPYDGVVRKDRRTKLITTKNDSYSHGIGISSMEQSVKKYQGLLDISYTEEVFRLKALLYEMERKEGEIEIK